MNHFIGIGGVGMSALAFYLLKKGARVSGSDYSSSQILHNLKNAGAEIFVGHDPSHVMGKERVIYSSAIHPNNSALLRAQELNIPILHRSDLLERELNEKEALIVAGAHGKTSTTALLAHTLCVAGRNPSYIVGGFSASLDQNGHFGEGKEFVAEGDESDGSFLKTLPHIAIVTGVDFDHHDYWKEERFLLEAYYQFCQKSKWLIYDGDDPTLAGWNLKGEAYSYNQIKSFRQEGANAHFYFEIEGRLTSKLTLPQIGEHQAKNSLAVFLLATRLGISEEIIQKAFASYKGVSRRAEYLGEREGVLFYDDYAHHPEEIKAILKGMKKAFPERRLVALFQPHRSTRFKSLFQEFCHAFDEADEVIVTETYASSDPLFERGLEELMIDVMGRGLFCLKENVPQMLESLLRENDLLLTLGAGDVTRIGRERVAAESTPA